MIYEIADILLKHAPPTMFAWGYRNTPAALARGFTLHRFRETVRWAARHSPFYRKEFAARWIDPDYVRTPADLGDFFTTPEDLVKDPTSFICQKPNIVFESSGTSGKNKQVYYDHDELKSIGKTIGGGFRLMGLTEHDRVANAFDFNIWIPGLICHYGLMEAGIFSQAFGKVDPVEVYRRLKTNRFTAVIGEPTWLIRLTQLAEQDGGGHLRFLIGGAEEMPADAIPWMRKVWNGAVVKMNYASVEMATAIAFQPCDNHDGYHLNVSDFLPEIVEPDADGYGELVYTTLSRRTMPLIRYRSHDVTRIERTSCSCGLSTPRMSKLRGRRDELVVASGGNLYPLMYENILRRVGGLTHDWQVVFKLEGVREIMEINVESQRTDFEALETEIHRAATDLYPDLMKNLGLGIFEMRLVIHPPQKIRNGRKLRRLVDRRHFSPVPEAHEPEIERLSQRLFSRL
jgi:phenylacetate-CoA ligase